MEELLRTLNSLKQKGSEKNEPPFVEAFIPHGSADLTKIESKLKHVISATYKQVFKEVGSISIVGKGRSLNFMSLKEISSNQFVKLGVADELKNVFTFGLDMSGGHYFYDLEDTQKNGTEAIYFKYSGTKDWGGVKLIGLNLVDAINKILAGSDFGNDPWCQTGDYDKTWEDVFIKIHKKHNPDR